ncbi:hypothetical protein IW261DRAFT_1641734 [Armillaria novae-zelandiae]|uniref:Uncharacterized protein n=1 Tax=Armillaria novae-zelandiae TaxID=153914 RepID=A0AA39UHB9_9AGAR|nr:hypothetical protein IW261DRAFT_1641734 [Armillaria novae-zelandiae]
MKSAHFIFAIVAMTSASQNLDFSNPSKGVYIVTGLDNGLGQLVEHLESNSTIRVSRLLISDFSAHEVETNLGVEVYDEEMDYNWGCRRKNAARLVAGEKQRHDKAKKDIKLKYAILRQQALLGQVLGRVAPGLEALSYLEYKEPPWDDSGWPSLPSSLVFPSVTHPHLRILSSLPSLHDFSRLLPNLMHIRITGFSSMDQLPKELQPGYVPRGVVEALREWVLTQNVKSFGQSIFVCGFHGLIFNRMDIPSNITIILQPSYPVRDSGFCGTPGAEYESICPVMERITRLHPKAHFMWPSKVCHDAGKPLFPVERAIEVFETRREWERDVRSEKDMWWRRQTRKPSIEELGTDVNVDVPSNLYLSVHHNNL